MRLEELPGGDLVGRGLADLSAGRETEEALLVSIGASRLRRAGLPVPAAVPDADRRLYALLAARFGDDAHARYNALVRRLISFERSLECASRPRESGSAAS
jgi:hypothetical protein